MPLCRRRIPPPTITAWGRAMRSRWDGLVPAGPQLFRSAPFGATAVVAPIPALPIEGRKKAMRSARADAAEHNVTAALAPTEPAEIPGRFRSCREIGGLNAPGRPPLPTDDLRRPGQSKHSEERHSRAVEEDIMPSTVQFHRVLRATPDRVYRAFLDADAMAKWLPPNGFTGKVHHMDPKVGGSYKMSFTNFTSGKSQSFGGEYLELVPNERIRWTDRFEDANLPGEMKVTVRLKQVSVGTEVNIVQEGIPDMIPAEACVLGWQESLTLLAKLVEAEIPD